MFILFRHWRWIFSAVFLGALVLANLFEVERWPLSSNALYDYRIEYTTVRVLRARSTIPSCKDAYTYPQGYSWPMLYRSTAWRDYATRSLLREKKDPCFQNGIRFFTVRALRQSDGDFAALEEEI